MDCVFCRIIRGAEQADTVAFADEHVVAFPSLHQRSGNRGHLIVVPRDHVRNMYDADGELLAALLPRIRNLAVAVQAVAQADGTTLMQNNEPPGQDTFHLHFHIVPRFHGDDMYSADQSELSESALAEQAAALRRWLSSQ